MIPLERVSTGDALDAHIVQRNFDTLATSVIDTGGSWPVSASAR
jgi:hypothetical protein